MTDTLTILRCDPHKRATKIIYQGDAGPLIGDYAAGRWFSVESRPVDGIESLAGGLDRATDDARGFVIRGEALPDTDLRRCRRLLHPHPDGTPPTFCDRSRRWVIFDHDCADAPGGWDWQDGPLSAISLRATLPREFHGSTFWWSFSSGAGFKPGLRMKTAFWLSRPVSGEELGRWLADAPVDHAVFRPVQAIYIARPLLFRVADPVPVRTGLEWDFRDVVEVPELPAEERKTAAGLDFDGGGEQWRDRPAGAHGWPYAVLQDVVESIATTPPAGCNRWGGGGRHHALFCGALRVSGLIEEGFLEPAGTVRTLAAAARGAGIEDAEAARTIRNAFRQGGLAA